MEHSHPPQKHQLCPGSASYSCVDQFLTDDEEVWDELTSEINRVAKHSDEMMDKAIRRAEEGCIETQASIANLYQCINTLRKSCRKQGTETSCLWDGWSQTHHTRDDELGLPPQKDSCPVREGCKQDGLIHHPYNEPEDRSQRLSPQNSQRNLDEETLVDVMARPRQEAKHWEWSENDAAKHHRKALDRMIQAAEVAAEHAKRNNLSRQEVINAENELAKAVQAKNSWYQVQKAGLNAEACIASPTTRMVEPTFNWMMNVGDPWTDMEHETIHYRRQSVAPTVRATLERRGGYTITWADRGENQSMNN